MSQGRDALPTPASQSPSTLFLFSHFRHSRSRASRNAAKPSVMHIARTEGPSASMIDKTHLVFRGGKARTPWHFHGNGRQARSELGIAIRGHETMFQGECVLLGGGNLYSWFPRSARSLGRWSHLAPQVPGNLHRTECQLTVFLFGLWHSAGPTPSDVYPATCSHIFPSIGHATCTVLRILGLGAKHETRAGFNACRAQRLLETPESDARCQPEWKCFYFFTYA